MLRNGNLLLQTSWPLVTAEERRARLEEETEEEEDEHKKNESLDGEKYNHEPGNIKGDDDEGGHLDHHVEEVEPLELPPAGHLRLRLVPEDKVPDPLQVTSRLSQVSKYRIDTWQ